VKHFKKINIKSLSELKNYSIEELEIGKIIYSFLCGKYQSTNIDLRTVEPLVNYYLNYGLQVYLKVQSDIKRLNPSLIMTTNDRILSSAVILSAAKKLNIRAKIYYWGSSNTRMVEFSKTLYSSYPERQQKIIENWQKETTNSSFSEESLKNKFIESYTRIPKRSLQFQKYKESGKKYNRTLNKRLAVLYTTSQWEFSALANYQVSDTFNNQSNAFTEVAYILLKRNWEVVIKLHPRKDQRDVPNLEPKWINQLRTHGITVLGETTEIDTYELIKQADLNIVWESTVGLECIARGLPLLVLGDPYWVPQDNPIRAKNKKQVLMYLKNSNFKFDLVSVLPWFAYQINRGDDFRHVLIDYHNSSYQGNTILKKRSIIKGISKIRSYIKDKK
jgi:hypothetical protein